MRGKPSTTYYGAATLLIDHASWFLHLNLHTSTGAQEATEAKHQFEKIAKEHGITISKYRGDNGIYQSKLFKSSCDALNQKIMYWGINDHHQNNITECNI